jgi:hypothetical protein
MQKKLQIFISSTYEDLKEERQAAVSAILKAGHIPAGMELFTSGDESQMETIKRWIDASDVYMLILGGRYGSVEPTTSLSYTELEYDYAVSKNIPFFAVVITDEALDQKVKSAGMVVIEKTNTRELAAFRQKVLSKTSAFFSDVNGIRLAVYETINDFTARYDFKGWVSGTDVPDISTFTEQINKLREENQRLLNDYETLKRQLLDSEKRQDDDLSYDDLIEILEGIKIKTAVFNEKSKGEEQEYTLLSLLRIYGTHLTFGAIGDIENKKEAFIFFNVLPKLQHHGLAIRENVNGSRWGKFVLSPKGIGLIGYLDRLKVLGDKSEINLKELMAE